MARKKHNDESGETWLNTYADMVTLLLTFFVVLLSMSTTDMEKFDVLIQSLTPGAERGVATHGEATVVVEEPEDGLTMDTLYQLVKDYIEENEMESAMSVSKQNDLVYIRFNSQMLFEPDRYTMLSASKPLLEFIGEVLIIYEEKIRTVNICGHTAQTGRAGSDISDWRLSGERAATVAMFFQDQSGFDKMKMITFGYGDNYPIADNATEAGRSQNRRVELVIVGVESMTNFDVYGVLNEMYDETADPGDILTPGISEGTENVN